MGRSPRPLLHDLAERWCALRGLADERRSLVGRAAGDTLEIGAGTGANVPFYGALVRRLVLLEPDDAMAARLRQRLAEARPAEVVSARAESLPFADGSFDTVVSTLVLCSVDDPAAAVAEVARVLRPAGRLLFVEHVRSERARPARWQDRLAPAWSRVASGCQPNRATLATIDAGLAIEAVRHDRWPGVPFWLAPRVTGSARRRACRPPV